MGSNPIPSNTTTVRIPNIGNAQGDKKGQNVGRKPEILLEIKLRVFQFGIKESYEKDLQSRNCQTGLKGLT
jgi:hypothetical protein